MKNIFIYTGPVKSGKSTALFNWINDKNHVSGILSIVLEGKKHLYSISQKEMKCLESDSDKSVLVGKYSFDNEVFKWAKECLISDLKKKSGLLIIDEIGFLELKGEGLEPAFSEILNSISQQDISMLLVVRNSLVDEVVDFYKLEHSKIIKNLDSLDG